ncbi:MAG: GNAT family N-acetyltransferase [Armatimonadetes bacterium]|nr:GNAT family N-acetyltransferase [Armatimonadota bacterium]
MEIPAAAVVFVKAFAMLKSSTYPYVATDLLEQKPASKDRFLWLMRDTPGRKHARKAEVITYGVSPQEVADAVRDWRVGWHFLGVMHESESFEKVKVEFKASGYRSLATEWLFVHDLSSLPSYRSSIPVECVESRADAERLNRLAGGRVLRPADFEEQGVSFRQYVMADDVDVFGKVRSVAVGEDAWVSDLWVRPIYRGRGYGKALMARMLGDDKEAGVRHSVLLASKDGARIYPVLGYRQLAVMQMFCPKQR